MTGSRLWIKNFQKIIAIALMIAWIFIGVPRIWNFPPKIQEAQAAIALRGTTKIGSVGNGGDVTLTFDTGGNAPQTGDVVILFGGRGNISDAQAWGPITSGYTAIATINSTGPKFGVWYKVMGATADTTVTGEGGGSGAHGVAYGAYVIDGSTIDSAIFDQTAVSTGQVTQVPNGPAIVTQTDGALVVTHAAGGTNDMSRGTVSGYTLIPGASVNETNDFASEAAYTTVATAGTEDPPAWINWRSSLGGAITIAFKPKQTTTLATGTDPSTATVAPESGIRDAGSFTFQTSAGSDSITALTVILAASGTPYNGLSEVRVTNNAGTTTYFSAISNPLSNTLNFSGGTPIPASASSTQFKIRVTPKTHALISSPPGAEYNLSPYVSAWTGTNTKVGSDSNANTLTIDNLSPNNATSTSGSAGDAQVTLNWTTSNSGDFDTTSGSVILRWASGSAGSEVPAEGTDYSAGNTITTATVACAISSAGSASQSKIDGSGGSAGCTTSALTNDQQYTYKVFQKDTRGNYDVGVLIGTFSPSAAPNPVPTTTSISPTSKNAGESEFTLTVNGTNFISGSVVKFDGSSRTTTYVSSTQLTATIPASDLTAAGTFSITVFNPTPGGGTSDAQTLTVNNPVPTTTSIDPTGKTVGDSEFTMTVSGTLFISSSVVKFNGSDRTTTFVNSTTLTAAIPASDIASEGTFPITVFNPTPGGGESNSQTFTISVTPPTPNPVPTLTSISPSSATQNDPEFTMTLTGTDFVSTSVARFNGVSRTTTYVSSTQLTATIPSSDLTTAGNFPITVFTPSPGGGESGSKTFTVTPAPTAPTVPLPPVGEAVRPTTIIFSGKAFPGGKMFMVDKDIRYEKTVSQDTITNDDGTFYTSFIGILQGPHSFSLIIKDKEGRGSQTKFFNINTLVQDFVVKDLIIAPTVALAAYSVTRGTATVVKGYATPQSGVVAEIDGIIKKEAQVGQDGAYKLTIDTGPLEFGSHQMRLKQTLAGGKGESDYSPLKNFIVSRVLLPKADFNDDGAVDIRDWSIFLFHWGSKDMEKRMKIDLNNDGKIDISDFSIFVRNIRKK